MNGEHDTPPTVLPADVSADSAPASPQPSLTLRYELGLDDVVALAVHHRERSQAMRKQMRQAAGTIIALILLMGAGFAFGSEQPALPLGVAVIICVFFVILLAKSQKSVQTVGSIKKFYDEGDTRALIGCREMTLTDHTFVMRSPWVRHEVAYSVLTDVSGTDDHTFVFITALSAEIIPRAAVVEGDYAAFVAELRKRFDAAGKDDAPPPDMLQPWERKVAVPDDADAALRCAECGYNLSGADDHRCPRMRHAV